MSPKYAKGKVTTTQIEHAIGRMTRMRWAEYAKGDASVGFFADVDYTIDVLGRLHTERLADLRREGKDTT